MRQIFDVFRKANYELFLVGGAVRDLALGIPLEEIDDLDFCTNARPDVTLRMLRDAGLQTYDVGIQFGTVGAVLVGSAEEGYPKDCQVTTYRSKEYYRRGSRRPEVRFGDTLEQDLQRRDFSINSIAMNGDGQYIDPYDGLGDLRRGVLRVVSDPWETLAEDPLRILRIGRFISKLGFEAERNLRQAATDQASHILDISRERWLMEMNKLLRGPHADKGLQFLHDIGIFEHILPEVHYLVEEPGAFGGDAWGELLAMVMAVPSVLGPRWAALLYNAGFVAKQYEEDCPFARHQLRSAELVREIAARFRFDNATTTSITDLLRHQGLADAYRPGWSVPQVRRLARELGRDIPAVLAFEEALLPFTGAALDSEARAERAAWLGELRGRIDALRADDALFPELPSGIGNILIDALALRRGPVIGQLKEHLEELIIDGVLDSRQPSDYYVAHLKENPPQFLNTDAGDTRHGDDS